MFFILNHLNQRLCKDGQFRSIAHYGVSGENLRSFPTYDVAKRSVKGGERVVLIPNGFYMNSVGQIMTNDDIVYAENAIACDSKLTFNAIFRILSPGLYNTVQPTKKVSKTVPVQLDLHKMTVKGI